jgi:hypothetical protein
VFGLTISHDEKLYLALKECKGPYKTTKSAIMAILESSLDCELYTLTMADIYDAVWFLEDRIVSKTSIPKDRIDAATRSLLYERKLKSDGGGNYAVHPRYVHNVCLTSKYNQVKQKIEREEAEARKRQGFVYFVQWENDPNSVKIGYSKKPVDRFCSFLTSCPQRLVVLRAQKVESQHAEALLHEKFGPYRIKREWFSYEGDLRKYVESLDPSVAIDLDRKLTDDRKQDILIHYF